MSSTKLHHGLTPARREWIKPSVAKIDPRRAENGFVNNGPDNAFTNS